MKVTLCSGHRNIERCIYPSLRGATGTAFANGESERDYVDDIIRRMTPILQAKGIIVEYADAVTIANNGIAEGDICLFPHVDGAVNPDYRGGLIDRYLYSTTPAGDDKLINCIAEEYFAKSPIPLAQNHRNPNTNQYWAFQHVGAHTIGVLVELGTARYSTADAPYLQGDRQQVAQDLCDAIFKYFGIKTSDQENYELMLEQQRVSEELRKQQEAEARKKQAEEEAQKKAEAERQAEDARRKKEETSTTAPEAAQEPEKIKDGSTIESPINEPPEAPESVLNDNKGGFMLSKLKSRKLWALIVATVINILNTELSLGLPLEWINTMVMVYIGGQAYVDAKK